LKDEYTDSTKLLSPKGFLVVLELGFFECFSEPRGSIHYECRFTITVYFKTSSMKSLVASEFLDGKTLMDTIHKEFKWRGIISLKLPGPSLRYTDYLRSATTKLYV